MSREFEGTVTLLSCEIGSENRQTHDPNRFHI